MNATALRCPVTTRHVEPRAGRKNASLAPDPAGALACLTNEPAHKRALIGTGSRLPASVAVVLARLIDQATPADEIVARRCAPKIPLLLTRFDYPAGPVDVVESIGCADGALAYVHNRGYLLPSGVAKYMQAAANPAGQGISPLVMGEPLTKAIAVARQRGDTIELAGELIGRSAPGTVLLQYPTLDRQITVIAAVRSSQPCQTGQLAMQYLPGSAGAGNDFGTILLRNLSTTWCELDGRITVIGWTAGHSITPRVEAAVVPNLELSPRATAAVPGQTLPADQLVASVSLTAEYRDDQNGSLCTTHRIVPASWHFTVNSITLIVPNGRATAEATPAGAGGLITCRGQFGATSARVATT